MDKFDKKIRRMRRSPKIFDCFLTLFLIINIWMIVSNIKFMPEKIALVAIAITLCILLISGIGTIISIVIKYIDEKKLFEEYKEITVREGEFRELLFFAPNATFLQGPDIDDKVIIIGVSGTSIEKREMSKETAKKIFCDLTED